MSPEQRRKFNTAAGGLFIGAGVIAWALAAYFAVTPNPPKPVPVAGGAVVDIGSCRSALSVLGYQANLKGEEVEAFEPLGTDPKTQLDRASVATTMCKLQLKTFCMGEGCEKPGLSFTLARPVNAAPKAAAGKAAQPAGKGQPAKPADAGKPVSSQGAPAAVKS